ncbi:MAG: N-acylglucosamine 2-epimerase [Bacteroidetes bacterium]|nr:MAG: N-acylglucosamine 2-epimerase [Bacteroidota bacterium]
MMFKLYKRNVCYPCLALALVFLFCSGIPTPEKKQLAEQMEFSIQHELLNKWYPLSVDNEYGGFLSTFTDDFKPTGQQDKMIVTQARHVWSNAKAAEFYPNNPEYKKSAHHGFLFLKDVMWDKQYGGFYTLVTRKGEVKESGLGVKVAYGNAFAIYALAAYYQCSGDTAALNLAKKTFAWLEKFSHDPVHKGYFQHLQRDGTPVVRTASTPVTAETGYKDQNSSIHLLEAFTELYHVWPDPLLAERLREMLYLVRDTITNPDGYLILFFQNDWTPVSVRDSSRDFILHRHNLDYVSFGHNVETAYLLLEAAEALGMKDDPTTLKKAKRMVDHALKNGWDDKVGGFYDEGFYFKDSSGIRILRDTKNWWAQAEGLNSLLMMSDYFPNDELKYYEKFKLQWDYIQKYLIDHVNGDWYAAGLDKEPNMKTALKGQIWKGTYHVFRALTNCAERLDPDVTAPTAPSKLQFDRDKDAGSLVWHPSTDNKIVLGYNIYQGNERVGFTPLNYFPIASMSKQGQGEFVIKAVDLHGNESGPSNSITR